jgi:hypothetical protein
MHTSADRRVDIIEKGRYGSVVYREPAGSLSFYWEFGGGDTVAIVQVDDVAAWKAGPPWAAGRCAEILRFVADEVIRQKAPSGSAQIDAQAGCVTILEAKRSVQPPAPQGGFSVNTYRSLRMKLALIVLGVAAIVAAVLWMKNSMLQIKSNTGTPFGSSVRTEEHIATLIQALEPYTPNLHRDPSKDRYRIGLFLVPVDGRSPGRLIPIAGGLPASAFRLAKILGSDGRTLWFDVNGIGGLGLRSYALVTVADLRRANPSLDANWWEGTQGMQVNQRLRFTSRDRAHVLEVDPETRRAVPVTRQPDPTKSPFEPTPAIYLCSGLFTTTTEWLGLHSAAEVEREFKPKSWLRRIVRADDTKEQRRFYRGVVDPESSNDRRKIISMTALGNDEYLNAAFLRMNDASEPVRLAAPPGSLMVYTSQPGLKGTLMVARVATVGNILWKVDTGIDRSHLSQILPGERSMAFVGPRPMVPDKVSEPLLVIIDNNSGAVTTTSLWQ